MATLELLRGVARLGRRIHRYGNDFKAVRTLVRIRAAVELADGGGFFAPAKGRAAQAGSTATSYIDPAAPWQNAWVESLNARFRNEVLDAEEVATFGRGPLPCRRLATRLQPRAPPLRAEHDVAEATNGSVNPDSHKRWTDEPGPVSARPSSRSRRA